MEVGLRKVKLVAGVEPKVTALAPIKPVPVTVTTVPPVAGPVAGDRAVTVGTGAGLIQVPDRKVEWSVQ